jgi:hypothetical protein
MSHFTEMKVEFRQQNESAFIKALELQFGEGNVEVHSEPVGLHGYHGDDRSQKSLRSPDYAPPCEIVIRRRNIGMASNDIGYRRNEEGGYTAYVSEHDKSNTFTSEKRNSVFQEYTLLVAQKQLRDKNWSNFRRVKLDDGSVQLIASKLSR